MKKTFATATTKPVEARGILADRKPHAEPPKKSTVKRGRPVREAEKAKERITLNLTTAQKQKGLESAAGVPLSVFLVQELKKAGVI